MQSCIDTQIRGKQFVQLGVAKKWRPAKELTVSLPVETFDGSYLSAFIYCYILFVTAQGLLFKYD